MARILVVDDEKYIRELFSLELSEMKYEVITAESCHKLIKTIQISQPDLVILDIKLIDCDGLEMLQRIRECFADLPVIICSAYDSYKYDVKAIAADYYVVKSHDLSELKSKIKRALEAKASLLNNAVG